VQYRQPLLPYCAPCLLLLLLLPPCLQQRLRLPQLLLLPLQQHPSACRLLAQLQPCLRLLLLQLQQHSY
jgi:hypothetical protein